MINFNKIILRNFLSYGNDFTEVDLNFTEPTLILGKNFDSSVDGAIDSNGAGKTTILHAITYALYDNVISDIEKNNLINNINKKNMEVELVFCKNTQNYKIIRYRKNSARGGDGVLFLVEENGEYIDKTKSSVAETNKFIEEVLGIPFEVFTRIVAISASYEPFLSLPSSHASRANQRDFLENLFGYTEISQKAENLKLLIKQTNSAITTESAVLESKKKMHEIYQNQLKSFEDKIDQWDLNQKETIKQLTKNKDKYKDIDFSVQKEIFDNIEKLKSTIFKKETQINSLKTNYERILLNNKKCKEWDIAHAEKIKRAKQILENTDISLIDELLSLCEVKDEKVKSLAEVRNQERELTNQISESDTLIEKLASELSHLEQNNCPYCLQKYPNTTLKIDEIDLKITELKSSQLSLNKKKDALEKEKTKIEKTISKIDSLLGNKDKKSLEKEMVEFKKVEQELSSLEQQKNPLSMEVAEFDADEIQDSLGELTKEMQELKKYSLFNSLSECMQAENELSNIVNKIKELETQTNPFTDAIAELKSNPPEPLDYKVLEELDTELEHQNFLLKLLTKKDSFIRKNILNTNIPFLNNRLQIYLKKMGLPHQVEFTDEMAAEIKQLGTKINYGNLSAGQKARINLALSFAFRDVLQSRHGKVSFCILDECLDVGLGSLGIQQAVKMIKQVAEENKLSMLVISHRDEVTSMFKKNIMVELRNGFSSIIQ